MDAQRIGIVGASALVLGLITTASSGAVVKEVEWPFLGLKATNVTGGIVSPGYTGTLSVTGDADSVLSFRKVNAVNDLGSAIFTGPGVGGLSFSATLHWTAGVIAAGSTISFSVDSNGDGLFDAMDDSFSAAFVTGTGSIGDQDGDPTKLRLGAELVSLSVLDGGDAGSDWGGSVLPASFPAGSFFQFTINKALINAGAGSMDGDTNVSVFAMIPLPTPVGLASAGLLGLAVIRRRRSV